MNACLSGTPFVGVGMHPEQEANLEACVRKGFAIRLIKRKLTASKVLAAIEKLLHNEAAKEKITVFCKQLQQWDAPENASQFLSKNFI